jgi:hypothetical protein
MRADREHLVDDLLADPDAGTLAAGRTVLRRRRIVRRLRVGGIALTAAGLIFLLQRAPAPSATETRPAIAASAPEHTPGPAPDRPPAAATLRRATPGALPGKPVALAMVKGETRLLFARPEDERLHVGLRRE